MYCKRCGHKIPEGAVFCSVCGASFKALVLPEPGQVKALLKRLVQKLVRLMPAGKKTENSKRADKKDKKAAAKSVSDKAQKPRWYRQRWPYIAASVVAGIAVIALTGLLALWTAAVLAPRERIVEFEDERLERAIRETLGIYDKDISSKDLVELTALDLSNRGIENIEPLSYFTGLQSLDLSGNRISDIGALSGLTHIEELALGDNRISDLTALAALTQLETLVLSDNAVKDITALAVCDKLCRLELQNNPVSDISAAGGMNALAYVNLKGTGITDISAIAGRVQIDMDNQKITELRLGFGDFFRLDKLALPISVGDAAVKWSTTDESVVAVEDGIARATHIQDFVYSPFSKQAILTGQVLGLGVVFEYHVFVEHGAYTWDYEEKVTKYKSKSNVATGYAELILPAVENVVAMDIEYEITVTKGKIHAFAFRAFINDKEWKNFGKIDISQSAIGFATIDFGEPVKLSKYWIVCTDGKTGTWSSFTFIDKIYYAQQEVDVSKLSSKSPSAAKAV